MNALGRLPSAGSGAASGPPTRGSRARWGMKSEVFRSNSTHRTRLRPPAPCAPRTSRSSSPSPSLWRRRPFREAPQDLRRRGRCRTRSGGQGSGGPSALRCGGNGNHLSSDQSTSLQSEVVERVIITLPIHPLVGRSLPFLREVRDREGRRSVVVEHPAGWALRVPVSWTDRSVSPTPPTVDGQVVRASSVGLRQLAGEVAILLRSLDAARAEDTITPTFGKENIHNAEASPVPAASRPGVGGALDGDPRRPARADGGAGAAGDPNPGDGQGGGP
jgi:hypothetical protein